MKMTDAEQSQVADLVCQILTKIYVDNPSRFRKEAADLGVSLEQFAAMSIAQTIRDYIDRKPTNGNGEQE